MSGLTYLPTYGRSGGLSIAIPPKRELDGVGFEDGAHSRPDHVARRIAEHDRLRSEYVRKLVQDAAPTEPPHVTATIPKVIVQYWHDRFAIPADVHECLDSWQPLMRQGFKRLLFDDYEARRLISKGLGRPYVTAFDRCHHPAMRCDYFRLCYMVRRGGLYIDADEVYQGADCQILLRDNNLKIQPLCYDQLTDTMVETEVFVWRRAYSPDWTFYINNNPLVAPAGHPIRRLALDRSTRLLLRSGRKRLDIQSTTGPGNFTVSLVRHAIDSGLAGKIRDFSFLANWETISVSRWPMSYRGDDRNWRRWRPN